MSKFSKLREAMKNPPEERLCLINANAYKLNILGIIIACTFLIRFGVWYISFVFIFSTIINWVGYKREMKQYEGIILAKKMMGTYKKIKQDPSFTRRRFRTIDENIGGWIKYPILFILLLPTWAITDIASRSIPLQILIILNIVAAFIFWYLFPVYWVATMVTKNGKD